MRYILITRIALAAALYSTVMLFGWSSAATETPQTPKWSAADMDFFLHGSMSTEMVPEAVLTAFISTYPDLFPKSNLEHLGLIPDPSFGWPVGFSRGKPAHLGKLSSVGINCASCHVGEIRSSPDAEPVRVLGVTSHFDAEAFFGSVIVATFRTQDPANMKQFLRAYITASDPTPATAAQAEFDRLWQQQEAAIIAAMKEDPAGAQGAGPGGLHELSTDQLRLDQKTLTGGADLAKTSQAMLKLFHNMRAALHVPDEPPEKSPPPSGPGRNDAFGLLSYALFNTPQPYAPVKYGVVWNLHDRKWVHWDGNTRSPIGRNLLASVGLGAPLIDTQARLDLAVVQRQTDLSEQIRSPRYPFAIDQAAAKRGAVHYQTNCASCHDGPESDQRLYDLAELGTDPTRARAFTAQQAASFNKFLAELQTTGYRASDQPGIRSTGKYWAPSLAGVWARSPYLHNGSVRTMQQLLTPPANRARSFHRGSRIHDADQMGYTDEGSYLFDTTTPGNSSAGHDFGTKLTDAQKRELIEYLKTL